MEGLHVNKNTREEVNILESEEYKKLEESLNKVSIVLSKAVYKSETLDNEERKNIGRVLLFSQTLKQNITKDDLESTKNSLEKISENVLSEEDKYSINNSINKLLLSI